MNHITLCTACDGKLSTIEGLFDSIKKQTRLPDRIVLLMYVAIQQTAFDSFVQSVKKTYPSLANRLTIFSHHNTNYIPWKYHGYDRQFLVDQLQISSWAKHSVSQTISQESQFLTLMVDVDNEFEPWFVDSLLSEYQYLQMTQEQDFLLAPTVMRRKTDRIQSQWIKWYSFLIPKYRYASFSAEQSPQEVLMMGANCFFWKNEIFKAVGFDPLFAWSYEDIDFTYRLSKAGIKLYVTATTKINHMESDRSLLDHKLIWNTTTAYYRMKNHMLFVRKNANRWQKIQAFSFGIWWLYIWFVINVLIYGGKERWRLTKALSRGLRDGLMYKAVDVSKVQMH